MNRQRTGWPTSLLAVAFAVSVAAAGCTTKASGPGENAPGVSRKQISLGVLSDLTGPFAASSEQQLVGARLYWQARNADGGVCDRQVRLVVRDHHYDPQAAVSLYSELEPAILGLQISVGTPTTAAVLSQLERDQVMTMLMGFSPDLLGSSALAVPGTPYDVEMVSAVDYLVQNDVLAEGDTIGYIYLEGDYGEPGLAGASFAAKRHGLEVRGQQVDPTASDMAPQVERLRRAGVDAIFMSATPGQLASAAAVSAAQGTTVPIVSAQPGWAPELLDTGAASALEKSLTVVSSVAPFGSSAEGPERLNALFEKESPQVSPSWGVSLGYAVSAIMDQALTAACDSGQLTRAGLQDAFQQMGSFDLDGTVVNPDYSQPGQPPSTRTFVLEPDSQAPGGLVEVASGYTGSTTADYLAQK